MESGAALRRVRPPVGAEVRAAVRPVTLAGEQAFPVDPALGELFPDGLRRGEVVAVEGCASVSCALALAAGPSAAGSWTLVAGLAGPGGVGAAGPDAGAGPGVAGPGGASAGGSGAGRVAVHLGVGAAVAFGVVPERLVVLAPGLLDGAAWVAALTAAVDGFDVVVVRPPAGMSPGLWRRLGPRVRDRGGVLVGVDLPGGWERATTVRTTDASWAGIGAGHGHLQGRAVTVERVGRGAAVRPRRAELLLPGPAGRAERPIPESLRGAGPAADGAAVVDLVRRVG